MDILKKVETLLNAAARSKLPRWERRSILDEEEEKILAEIRQALHDVEAQERVLAKRVKEERGQAAVAAEQGNLTEKNTHERRAFELERQLEQESIQAINIEEKLAALEEKLARAKQAVDDEARKVAERDEAASKIIDRYEAEMPGEEASPRPVVERPKPRDTSVKARKSRLSG